MENQTKVEETSKSSQIATMGDILMPDVGKATQAMAAFEKLKSDLLVPEQDKVNIQGKMAITRSGFSKIALAFGLSTEIVKIQRIKTENDYIVHVVAKASAPNGRYSEANASCSLSEFKTGIEGTIANIEAKAGTRATSRAIANLCGGGVLSKDEMPEVELISQKQADYIKTLSKDNPKTASILGEYLESNDANLLELTKAQAHDLIEKLKAR